MGWDDNGLNVERRVQLVTGTIVDPTLPYDPDFRRPEKVDPKARPIPVSRPNFIELCEEVVAEQFEAAYHELWSTVGPVGRLGPHLHDDRRQGRAHVAARRSCACVARGLAYRAESPTLWDVDMRDVGRPGRARGPGAARRVPPARVPRGPTASPLLHRHHPPRAARRVRRRRRPPRRRALPAAVRHRRSPRRCSSVEVPIVAHELADPEKGIGHRDDLHVRRHHRRHLVARAVAAGARRSSSATAASPSPGASRLGVDDAARRRPRTTSSPARPSSRRRRASSSCSPRRATSTARSEPITHPVKFWENGTRPLEIVTSRQWFIRYPPKDELLGPRQGAALVARLHAGPLRELGQRPHRRLEHHPPALLRRAVPGLVPDRRRRRRRLPVRRSSPTRRRCPSTRPPTCPPGYDESQRNQPGGFAADPDVMDTWATSSLTPQIVVRLGGRPRPVRAHRSRWTCARRPTRSSAPGCSRTRRPQPLRARLRCRGRNAAISGFVVDPDRKKLSKSAGNTPDDPNDLLDRVRRRRGPLLGGQRPARAWTSRSTRNQMKVGRRLAIKLLNASKFVARLRRADGDATPSPSRSTGRCSTELADLVDEATAAFERFDYARALERTEAFFWSFCDDYLELVKSRAYGDGDRAPRRPARRCARAVDAAPAVRAVPAVRHRRGVVVVAGRLDPPRGVAGAELPPGRRRRGVRRRGRCWRSRKAKTPRRSRAGRRPRASCRHAESSQRSMPRGT